MSEMPISVKLLNVKIVFAGQVARLLESGVCRIVYNGMHVLCVL